MQSNIFNLWLNHQIIGVHTVALNISVLQFLLLSVFNTEWHLSWPFNPDLQKICLTIVFLPAFFNFSKLN